MAVRNYHVKIKLWENGRVMGMLTVLTVILVTIIFLLCELPSFRTHSTSLPSVDPEVTQLKPVTPNKNVNRINYMHYHVLRLANLTRDAVEGLAEQLGPTYLMAVQNRMAFDMVLAGKGDVCVMFRQMCCTLIPNNTVPDGSITNSGGAANSGP